MPDKNAGLWEAVRRALGRLASSVQVRELPPARLLPTLSVLGQDALDAPACEAGRGEAAWPLGARTVPLPPPRTGAGGGGTDLAAVAAVVSLDAALRSGAAPVWESPPIAPGVAVHSQAIVEVGALAVRDAPVVLVPGAVRAGLAAPAAPAVARLTAESPRLPKRPLLPGPRRARAGAEPVPFAAARVRPGLAACAQVPLIRMRRPPPPDLSVAQAFAAERHRLAQASGADLGDVILLGVYPQVPVAAVRRLALGDDGRSLSLWLRPEALSAVAAGRPPRLATLILGRLRSTGRMIQAIA